MLRDDLFSFQFLKKSRFSGSFQGMNYRIEKTEGPVLTASVFPGPYAYEYTRPEQIVSAEFPFDEEGYEQAKDWLEEQAAGRDWLRL